MSEYSSARISSSTRPQHPIDGRVDELIRADVFSGPGRHRAEKVGVLLQALVQIALHRSAKESIPVESAGERGADKSDEQRQRERPFVRLANDGHGRWCNVIIRAEYSPVGGCSLSRHL